MRKRLQIFCLLLLPCLTLMGILGRGSPAALSASSDAAIPASADNWGLSFPAEHETPIGNATADFLTQYDAWYVGDTSQKVIYLTFDCGYENGNTGAILDALKKHSAPAAFFVVGHMIESAPDIVRRMAAEGHIVGNHTYHHPDMSAISDKASFQKELDSLAALYQEITGQELSHFYRPPQGKYSEQNLKLAQELGYQTVFWSLAYVDWYADNQPTAEQAYAKLLPRIHNGAIVLLHSTSSTNAAILDDLLSKWEDMGYRFAPLPSPDHLPRRFQKISLLKITLPRGYSSGQRCSFFPFQQGQQQSADQNSEIRQIPYIAADLRQLGKLHIVIDRAAPQPLPQVAETTAQGQSRSYGTAAAEHPHQRQNQNGQRRYQLPFQRQAEGRAVIPQGRQSDASSPEKCVLPLRAVQKPP